MLEDLPCAPRERSLKVTGLPDEVLPFFRCLLGEWGYDVQSRESGLVLVRAGHSRIRKMPAGEPLSLGGSIDLPTLWSTIESRFHATARRHIRLRCDIPAELNFAGMRRTSRFISISDAGGRLIFPQELVRGEAGRVVFPMGNQLFETPCEVIYVIPRREWEESPGTEIGVVFRWPDPRYCRQVRQGIVQQYMERVAGRIGEKDYRAGVAFFDLQEGRTSKKPKTHHQDTKTQR